MHKYQKIIIMNHLKIVTYKSDNTLKFKTTINLLAILKQYIEMYGQDLTDIHASCDSYVANYYKAKQTPIFLLKLKRSFQDEKGNNI